MWTPRKNLNSPYAKPVQQYPSQSEDYISLDMGGPKQAKNTVSPPFHGKTNDYNTKYYQQNYRNSSGKVNRRNLFHNNNSGSQNYKQQSFNQQPRYTPRNNHADSNQKKYHHNVAKTNGNTNILSYIHPSMIEDPWSDLVQRMQALNRSTISLNNSSPKGASPPPFESSCNTDSGNLTDEGLDSAESDL